MQRPREDIPVHWTTYIATQDADAAVARAKELGATILSEPMDGPKMGRFAIIQDPIGAVFGIWQSAS
jgi:predicted enzyme related to lactoylglutathione lyase